MGPLPHSLQTSSGGSENFRITSKRRPHACAPYNPHMIRRAALFLVLATTISACGYNGLVEADEAVRE